MDGVLILAHGSKRQGVIPMFLFDGTHVNVDIPREIDNLRKKYPNIKIIMSKHLGDDERIAEIVVDRIKSVD